MAGPVQEGNPGVALPTWRPPHEKFVELFTFTSLTQPAGAVCGNWSDSEIRGQRR
jgi:hypothetical protein